MRTILIIVGAIGTIVLFGGSGVEAKDPPESILAIAKIARIKVGIDTRETLERRLGPGTVIVGGHPRGARVWRWRQAGWFIHADAFSYRKEGIVVEEVTVYSAKGWPGLTADFPKLTLGRKELSLLGAISLGMTKAEVLNIAKSKLPPPEIKGDTVTWKARGFVRLNQQEIFDTWKAKLAFIGDRLEKLTVTCY